MGSIFGNHVQRDALKALHFLRGYALSIPSRYVRAGTFPAWERVSRSHSQFSNRACCEYRREILLVNDDPSLVPRQHRAVGSKRSPNRSCQVLIRARKYPRMRSNTTGNSKMSGSINPKHLNKTSHWVLITIIVMPMRSSHPWCRHSLHASVAIAHSHAGIA